MRICKACAYAVKKQLGAGFFVVFFENAPQGARGCNFILDGYKRVIVFTLMSIRPF